MEAGPSNSKADSPDDSFGFTSESFDPLRVIYAPSLGDQDSNVEIFDSVSEFIKNVRLESSSEISSATHYNPEHCGSTVPDSGATERKVSIADNVDGATVEANRETLAACIESFSRTRADASGTANISDNATGEIEPLPVAEWVATEESPQLMVQVSEQVEDSQTENVENKADGKTVPAVQSRESTLTFRKRRERRTILTEMENGFKQGPLTLLKRSVEENIKVRVWTRSVRNIRGISTGYVVAFDKHMNLALMDVDEVYRKPVGKHQKKSKREKDKGLTPQTSSEEGQTAELCYPNTPWQPVRPPTSVTTRAVIRDDAEDWDDSDASDLNSYFPSAPADGVSDLPSAFSGIQVFEETETTRLLGTKTRRLLRRHLNQVLLRGDHVVAVALVDMPSE